MRTRPQPPFAVAQAKDWTLGLIAPDFVLVADRIAPESQCPHSPQNSRPDSGYLRRFDQSGLRVSVKRLGSYRTSRRRSQTSRSSIGSVTSRSSPASVSMHPIVAGTVSTRLRVRLCQRAPLGALGLGAGVIPRRVKAVPTPYT